MKKLVFFVFSLILTGCSKNQHTEFDPLIYIPEESEFVVHSPDLRAFSKKLHTNNFIAANELTLKTKLAKSINFLQYLNLNENSTLTFSNINSDSLVFSLATRRDSSLVKLDSVKNKSLETITYKDLSIQQFDLESSSFYLLETKNAHIISNSMDRLAGLVKKQGAIEDTELRKAFEASDPERTSIFIKHAALKSLGKSFSNLNFPSFGTFANWSVVDIDITKAEIKANGLSLGDSKLLNAFSGVSPRTIESIKVCPDNFTSLYALGYSSFKDLHSGLPKRDSIEDSYPALLDDTREVAIIKLSDASVLVLNAIEIEAAKEDLAGLGDKIESYREASIIRLNSGIGLKGSIHQLMELEEPEFYTILDHFIIFSESPDALKTLISSYQNSSTIAEKSYFQELNSKLSSESSLLFLARIPEASGIFPNTTSAVKAEKNSMAAFQWVGEGDYAHIHSAFINSKNQAFHGNGVEQSQSIKLNNALVTKPFFFKNHRTDQMDIAVQDKNNNLHLISNKGNIFWSKGLDSKINGKIHEVDLFQNGNKQLAFTTGYNMEVMDRDGNKVKGFPIRFNQALTQPLSVFDYDNNRKYRFVLTQNKRVYMVGPRGKAIKGFDFDATTTEVIQPPKHIRLGTKDYILIPEKSGRLNILSRQGKIRVPFGEKLDFSQNEWYGFKDQFVSTEENTNLIKINQNGKVSRENLELAENNRIVASDDHLVYLNENQLSIDGQIVELDFGLYTDPQLFEFKRRSLIAITDTQTQKVFVYNTKGELLEGFPIYGNSQVDIANADLDPKLELIVVGDENEILVYEF